MGEIELTYFSYFQLLENLFILNFSGSKYHICNALGNYGQITVDWETRRLRMTVRTPIEKEEAYHEIGF